jgi:hypothetical protein
MVGRSIADLIRKAIKRRRRKHVAIDFDQMVKRSLGVAGRFSSGLHEVSAHHDRYLANAFKK